VNAEAVVEADASEGGEEDKAVKIGVEDRLATDATIGDVVERIGRDGLGPEAMASETCHAP
jgi:hypothetical protein